MPARISIRPVTTALLLAALAAGAAACGSSSSHAAKSASGGTPTSERSHVSGTGPVSASSDDGPNPCTIVSAADVDAILGTNASPSGPKSENRGHQCTWHPGNGASVLVQV